MSLSDIVDVLLKSNVVLTPNGQILGCATVAFNERYGHNSRCIYFFCVSLIPDLVTKEKKNITYICIQSKKGYRKANKENS